MRSDRKAERSPRGSPSASREDARSGTGNRDQLETQNSSFFVTSKHGSFTTGEVRPGREMRLPRRVTIVEVGPRDGLQIERAIVPTTRKIELIKRLAEAGIKCFEISSFVNPQKVPQLADAEELFQELRNTASLTCMALVPNEKGYERARSCEVKHIRVVVMASETFNERNFNRGIEEAMEEYARVVRLARSDGVKVSGVIGASFGCPYEGKIPPRRVLQLADQFAEYGVKQIVLADTIGIATPPQVYTLLSLAHETLPRAVWGCHFHNRRNTGLANVLAAMQAGVNLFDTAIGGLGGCPFAPDAMGNIATEDLAFMLQGMGIETGVDLKKTIAVALWLEAVLGKTLLGHTPLEDAVGAPMGA